MLVSIREEAIRLNQHLTDHVHRGLMFSLGRFSGRIRRVKVTIADVNGPRGGDDKRCQLTVSGPRLNTVNLTETHANIFAGVDLALDRLAHVIGRSLERARDPRATSETRSVT